MTHDVIIRTEPHQLTAFQVLGVMLDAMRQNRDVRCWLVVPKGTADNWKDRVRVVLAKQRKRIYEQVVAHERDPKDAMFGRLFSLNFSKEVAPVNKSEVALLVKYHETLAHKRSRVMIQHFSKHGIW